MTGEQPNRISLALTEKELLALYLLLKKQESNPESTLCNLLIRLEKFLYATLTIEEMENLQKSK